MEERILARMPELFLAVIVPAAACALLAPAPLVAILALAVATAWALSLVPLALGCAIVVAMKSPARARTRRAQDGAYAEFKSQLRNSADRESIKSRPPVAAIPS